MGKRKTLREVDFGETRNMASVNGPVASVSFFLVLQLNGGKKRSLSSFDYLIQIYVAERR
jgi:hypothetical protein